MPQFPTPQNPLERSLSNTSTSSTHTIRGSSSSTGANSSSPTQAGNAGSNPHSNNPYLQENMNRSHSTGQVQGQGVNGSGGNNGGGRDNSGGDIGLSSPSSSAPDRTQHPPYPPTSSNSNSSTDRKPPPSSAGTVIPGSINGSTALSASGMNTHKPENIGSLPSSTSTSTSAGVSTTWRAANNNTAQQGSQAGQGVQSGGQGAGYVNRQGGAGGGQGRDYVQPYGNGGVGGAGGGGGQNGNGGNNGKSRYAIPHLLPRPYSFPSFALRARAGQIGCSIITDHQLTHAFSLSSFLSPLQFMLPSVLQFPSAPPSLLHPPLPLAFQSSSPQIHSSTLLIPHPSIPPPDPQNRLTNHLIRPPMGRPLPFPPPVAAQRDFRDEDGAFAGGGEGESRITPHLAPPHIKYLRLRKDADRRNGIAWAGVGQDRSTNQRQDSTT